MTQLKIRICTLIISTLMLLNSHPSFGSPPEKDFSSGWSSSDPKTIPYRERLKQFKKGNLVSNPSFEQGRLSAGDTGDTFNLNGWETFGAHVIWVDSANNPDTADEVSDGSHAVKVERENAGETNAAEGVASDFIPVIPGNYSLTYKIKLKNISGSRYRLGLRLYDAIAVKIFFFDKDKNPVASQSPDPDRKVLIDISDKSYAFANYWTIDNFPWGTVRGRTYHYPFSEGDIPDRTRYVRLFFGLKGTGTVWLDSIDYHYSKWNFTALERMRPYFNRTLRTKARLVPEPKKFRRLNDTSYFNPSAQDRAFPVIVLPDDPAPADRTAAKILQQKLIAVIDKIISPEHVDESKIRIKEKVRSDDNVLNTRLVFSIGMNSLYRKRQPALPLESIRGKQQGYIIGSEQIGDCLVVYLIGNAPIGNYYAAATAAQLLSDDSGVYHNAAVIDYPDFLGRSYLMKAWRNQRELQSDLDSMQRMSLYKLNTAYIDNTSQPKIWYRPSALYRSGVAASGRKCRETGVVNLAVMVNPYFQFPFAPSEEKLSDKLRYTWTHDSQESFNVLQDVFKIGLDAGAKTIMLLADDHVPHSGQNPVNYGLYTVEDRKRFVNLQNAQAHIINGLKQWIDKDYPGTRFEFCPPWYTNEFIDQSQGLAEVYFKELTYQIPQDIAIIWTGPTVRSLSIDMADLYRFKSLIGRWPMIWDNTLYARNTESQRYGGYATHYPGKVRMCNLFEPYDIYKPDNFQLYSDSRHMYMNGNARSEIYKIKYATVADYAWNTAAYDPERSLWKAMVQAYGKAGARALLLFNDTYYSLNGVCLRMELEGVEKTYIKKGNTLLKGLDYELKQIAAVLPQETTLIKELEQYRNRQKKRFEKLTDATQ